MNASKVRNFVERSSFSGKTSPSSPLPSETPSPKPPKSKLIRSMPKICFWNYAAIKFTSLSLSRTFANWLSSTYLPHSALGLGLNTLYPLRLGLDSRSILRKRNSKPFSTLQYLAALEITKTRRSTSSSVSAPSACNRWRSWNKQNQYNKYNTRRENVFFIFITAFR